MSQQSSGQTGPQQDEQLKHETQGMEKAGHSTRAEEWRDPEPSGEDQPDVERGDPTELKEDPDAAMTASEVEARSRIGQHLQLSAFPGDRDRLVASALEFHAPDDVLETLRSLPGGQTFTDVQDVARQLGLVHGADDDTN